MITYEQWQIIQQLLTEYLNDNPDISVIPDEEVLQIYKVAYESTTEQHTGNSSLVDRTTMFREQPE